MTMKNSLSVNCLGKRENAFPSMFPIFSKRKSQNPSYNLSVCEQFQCGQFDEDSFLINRPLSKQSLGKKPFENIMKQDVFVKH